MIDYIINNKEWIFSGIGVALIGWFIIHSAGKKSQRQKGGKGSTNIQVGSDLNVISGEQDGANSKTRSEGRK